jgi:hypothetical protein
MKKKRPDVGCLSLFPRPLLSVADLSGRYLGFNTHEDPKYRRVVLLLDPGEVPTPFGFRPKLGGEAVAR